MIVDLHLWLISDLLTWLKKNAKRVVIVSPGEGPLRSPIPGLPLPRNWPLVNVKIKDHPR